MTTINLPDSLPSPTEPNGWTIELTEEQRHALPATYHRPHFDGLGRPLTWICSVCWGDDYTTRWPCDTATAGGVELAKSLGVGWSW